MAKVKASALKAPLGPLIAGLFRGDEEEDFDKRVESLVEKAGAEVLARVGATLYNGATGGVLQALLQAEENYALHLAYKGIVGVNAALPTMVTEVNLTAQYTQNLGELRKLSADYKADFEAAIARALSSTPEEPSPASGGVTVSWGPW